jgi:GT2 family glycosyltransferase
VRLSPVQDRRDGFATTGAHADVAVIVVTYNSASDIAPLIDDLRAAARDRPVRLIVVDNQSSDGTANVVRVHSDVTLIESGGNLGYAGGINAALPFTEPCDAVLILNPDLQLKPDAVTRLLEPLVADVRVGAVVPRIIDTDEKTYPSLRYEPSLTRAFGDAFFGSKLWLNRPGLLSEFDYRPASYLQAHDVDWATGAALLIRTEVVRELGKWNEAFFLFSEETEYFRRIRKSGYLVRFEPSAVVQHRLGGCGTSQHSTLLAVNRIRYAELHHGASYSAIFRAAVALAEALRSYDPAHRRTLGVVINRGRWRDLPTATKPTVVEQICGPRNRGAVIVPAYNEAAVIERTLAPLSQPAVDGFIELIVVCNGCTDDTAERARRVPGAQVVELDVGSKPLALNTGDELATLWPRLYLDADIDITATAVIAVLDRLKLGDVLAARPAFRYDTDGASLLVRSYYRARRRMSLHQNALWWAGVYGLNIQGHERFGLFPDVTGDDMFVDTQFEIAEKTVVKTEPSVWRTPSNAKSLIAVLGRHHRGNTELVVRDPVRTPRTGKATAGAILRTIRGPQSAADAVVYLGMALAARRRALRGKVGKVTWEHDESSRSSR